MLLLQDMEIWRTLNTLNIKLPTSFLISFIVFKIVRVQPHLKNQILKTIFM